MNDSEWKREIRKALQMVKDGYIADARTALAQLANGKTVNVDDTVSEPCWNALPPPYDTRLTFKSEQELLDAQCAKGS